MLRLALGAPEENNPRGSRSLPDAASILAERMGAIHSPIPRPPGLFATDDPDPPRNRTSGPPHASAHA